MLWVRLPGWEFHRACSAAAFMQQGIETQVSLFLCVLNSIVYCGCPVLTVLSVAPMLQLHPPLTLCTVSWHCRCLACRFGSACTVSVRDATFQWAHHVTILFSTTVRIWDIQPFAPVDRQLKIFRGNRHGFEKVCSGTP